MKAYHFTHRFAAAALLLAATATPAAGQGFQLENGFKNTFREQGAPGGPPPPPTPTVNQYNNGTAYGGWRTRLITDGDGNTLAGTTNTAAGKPTIGPAGTIVLPGTPPDTEGNFPPTTRRLAFQKFGRTMVLRQITIPLGSVIARPDRTPAGDLVPADDPNYYLPEPWNSIAGNADASDPRDIDGVPVARGRFYWSPNAQKVFATEPGRVTVVWKLRTPVNAADPDAPENFFTVAVSVSGSPAKATRRLYWTERGFNGPPVDVPAGRVAEVNVVYTSNFPREVAEGQDYQTLNDPPVDEDLALPPERRTLWFDDLDGRIHAYNLEGRVFVELLGDLREPERLFREHLGFEIVDVVQEVRPAELRVAIGEEVPSGDADPSLVPSVVAGLGVAVEPYLFEHVSLGGTKRTLYAVRETTPLVVVDRNGDDGFDRLDEQQSNEVLVYWLERGAMQLLWPKLYVGYIFQWPEDLLPAGATAADLARTTTEGDLRGFYSLFARPEAAADSPQTGVQLNSADNPVLAYQDDRTRRHAAITAQNVFVTTPGTGNRSLIRYTRGDAVWFERVYSRTNADFDDYGATPQVTVGSRIEAPGEGDSPIGYIRQTTGDAFNPGAYIDPFAAGFVAAAQGAIIPVNALPGNDLLEVWWFEQSQPPAGGPFTPTFWPSHVRRYKLAWPATDPDDEVRDEIVLARNDGSGGLGAASAGRIYRQPDPSLPGHNPNEEHALILNGVAWALRDDLNRPGVSSEPFVLVDYTAADGRPAMLVQRVVRENTEHTFRYGAEAGTVLQAPAPLPLLPLPIRADGSVANAEAGARTDVPPTFAGNAGGLEHYDSFTYADRKGTTWVYRGPHAEGVNVGSVNDPSKTFRMEYYYKTQTGFDFPAADGTNDPPPAGTIVPYLRPADTENPGGFLGDPVAGPPQQVVFTPTWPANPPVLGVAESLGLPKRGLPAVRGQTSARVLYEQSVAGDMAARVRSARLFDPTRAKTFALKGAAPLGLHEVPASAETSDFLGKTFFPQLPPHLSGRFFYDPNVGGFGSLTLVGEFVDEAAGEDFFLLNILSAEDVAAAKDLVDPSDLSKANWDSAIDGLSTTLETFVEDPGRRGTFKPDPALDAAAGPRDLAEVFSDDTAVDSYALSASGGGTGYVVLTAGDGRAFTPEAEPVALQVFKVAAPLYRGELKVVESANPLDEKVTLEHSGDFAGDPSDYEFAWVYGLAEDGRAPALYAFSAEAVLPNGAARSWRLLHNPEAGYPAARAAGFDDGTWSAIGDLTSGEIVIDGGAGAPANGTSLPHAVLRDEFTPAGPRPFDLFLSLTIADNDGAAVFINGSEAAVWNVPGRGNSLPADPPGTVAAAVLPLVFSVPPELVQPGVANTVTVDLYTVSDPGARTRFDLRLDGRQETADLSRWLALGATVKDDPASAGTDESAGELGKVRHTIQGASILTLVDSYLTMRYRARAGTPAALATGGSATDPGAWSRWMPAKFVPGWIKRVLNGINPFDQRVSDLFSNQVNTDVSLVAQAGKRWEGDVALNLANIDDFGLIEIYETVLGRGAGLSISGTPALNVPAANDALLLAAGQLSDLYVLVGNEAFADAANPTIAFDSGTVDFGSFNTALFAFKGQLANVLDEELALLRGRDDNLAPGVRVSPFYNKLVWNFTGGINAGEPIYSLNYNILDLNADGSADELDAAVQFPQGHGDAYGHYLTALKVYYQLLTNPNFAWTPRPEAQLVAGQEVAVDFQDERKFAAAAAGLVRAAAQTLDLTYRQEFTADGDAGWSHLRDGKENARTGVVRRWGTDEWAARAGQGAYFHWVTANSVLPERDDDPDHEGIEVVDRKTVPELGQVVAQFGNIQSTLDLADARLNPLGLARGAVSFDISPAALDAGETHYEQVYERAVAALRNAVFAFDGARRSTGFLRAQDNGAAEQRAAIDAQERVFENELIEIYGTPYPDDIGPGRTYAQGFAGPDLLHFSYVEVPELFFDPAEGVVEVELPLAPAFAEANSADLDLGAGGTVTFALSPAGDLVKPPSWTGRRAYPGALQTAVSELLAARHSVRAAADDYAGVSERMAVRLGIYLDIVAARDALEAFESRKSSEVERIEATIRSVKVVAETVITTADAISEAADAISEALPTSVGLSTDATSVARGAIKATAAVASTAQAGLAIFELGRELGLVDEIEDIEKAVAAMEEETAWNRENRQLIDQLHVDLGEFLDRRAAVDVALRRLDQAGRNYRALQARGLAVQAERLNFRQRAAAIVQGFRVRDLAFRVFRDEALEKYKTLFDLAARYTYLAAAAYDYETGLLDATGASAAARFFQEIVQGRALGVVDENGEPQFSSSETGDPGLAGVLASLRGDWSVAETRLGFNNPDRYRTAFSLRRENFRIVPGEAGDAAWRDRLAAFTMDDVLADADVRRYCMQIAREDGLPVPGIVIAFDTTVSRGFNFFGHPLLAGDGFFSPGSFATKIRAAGIAFEGYVGMDAPTSVGGAVGGIGGASPTDPGLGFLDPDGLARTPHVFLIPAGVDSMRSPPLGDTSTVRRWTVHDQAIPLPFNIGNSDFSERGEFVSADSLSEEPFAVRKHQAFRAVPAGTVFSSTPGFTNGRLVGRSVWNSSWKLIIPGDTLLNDPRKGLQIFQDTVTDIELYLETYSYAGN